MTNIVTEFEGDRLESAWLPATGGAPAVLVFPTVMGLSDLEVGFANRLNELGYGAMVADPFGVRTRGFAREAMRDEMVRVRSDRAALRRRLLVLLDSFRAAAGVDDTRLAAIGYCFGGLCALDLARSGIGIAGAASFHGVYDPPGLPPQPIRAKVVAYHGWDDPLARPESVVALGDELTAAGCDWQVHAYGHAAHGFTNPHAPGTGGIAFDQRAADRSWASLTLFLRECFGPQ